MSQTTSQQMDFVSTLGDDLDFTSFCENLQNPFEHDIFCVSPNQTVPSVSPDGSPYSSDNPDFYYLNEEVFGSLNDVCPLPIPPVESYIKQEPLKEPKNKTLTKSPILGKKRTRKTQNPNSKSAKLDFQNMNSKSLEEYQHHLESGRALTIEEERQLKKQRRLIKNRESAQLSRQRKKMYVSELETKVKNMNSENSQLRDQVARLNNQVMDLENQVAQFKATLNSITPAQHPKAALGLCMVVFLLSVGLFFPQNSSPVSPMEFSQHPSVYTGRVLQEIQPKAESEQLEAEVSLLDKRQLKEYVPEESSAKRPRLEVPDKGGNRLSSDQEDKTSSYGLMLVDPKAHPSLEQSEQEIRPETSVIYCSEVQTLSVSPNNDNLTVLLPASAFNGTIPLDESENALLEVSCQILNITVFPFYPGVDGRLDFPMINSI